MSSATKEILGRVRQLVPPMLDKFHKGESPPVLRDRCVRLCSGQSHGVPIRKERMMGHEADSMGETQVSRAV